MLRLRSRQNSPVGGFIFVDAAISPEPLQTWDFTSLVQQVASRRAANPRFGLTTDINAISAEVDLQNAQRMLSIRGADSFIVRDAEGGAANFPVPSRRSAPGAAVAEKMMAGAGVILDWLGAGGKAVPNELAERRASVCAVCPLNAKGDWTAWFTIPAAAVIQKEIERRNEMKLSTSYDDGLGVCTACACVNSLSVHAPIKHILSRLSEEVRAKLDQSCWKLDEQ
jgi:hypothetical protein